MKRQVTALSSHFRQSTVSWSETRLVQFRRVAGVDVRFYFMIVWMFCIFLKKNPLPTTTTRKRCFWSIRRFNWPISGRYLVPPNVVATAWDWILLSWLSILPINVVDFLNCLTSIIWGANVNSVARVFCVVQDRQEYRKWTDTRLILRSQSVTVFLELFCLRFRQLTLPSPLLPSPPTNSPTPSLPQKGCHRVEWQGPRP